MNIIIRGTLGAALLALLSPSVTGMGEQTDSPKLRHDLHVTTRYIGGEGVGIVRRVTDNLFHSMPFNFGHRGLRALSHNVEADPVGPSFIRSEEDMASVLLRRLDQQDVIIKDLKSQLENFMEEREMIGEGGPRHSSHDRVLKATASNGGGVADPILHLRKLYNPRTPEEERRLMSEIFFNKTATDRARNNTETIRVEKGEEDKVVVPRIKYERQAGTQARQSLFQGPAGDRRLQETCETGLDECLSYQDLHVCLASPSSSTPECIDIFALIAAWNDGYEVWCIDDDGDGFGDPGKGCILGLKSTETRRRLSTSGYAPNGGDCDDASNTTSPDATEVCNGIDDNCDGQIDEGLLVTVYLDADYDGYGNRYIAQSVCPDNIPTGFVLDNSDCNDSNFFVKPNATEVCDGIDNDCDGLVDEDVKTTFYHDWDHDSYGNSSESLEACTAPIGFVSDFTDCDDTNSAVFPGAFEVCDGLVNDCNKRPDGVVDENMTTVYFKDADYDGYGNATDTISACSIPWGYVVNDQDCDDSDPSIHPGATEVCNGKDDNCDGFIPPNEEDSDGDGVLDCNDECPSDSTKSSMIACYGDDDGDGYGDPNIYSYACDCASLGYVEDNTDDCPQDSDKISPGACGCGISDTDSDGDGTPDCLDNCPMDPNKTEPGDCGCDMPETDTDNDGTPDCIDGCPEHSLKTDPGVCGCDVPDDDNNGNGIADCNEPLLCTDQRLIAGNAGYCQVAGEGNNYARTVHSIEECYDCCLDPVHNRHANVNDVEFAVVERNGDGSIRSCSCLRGGYGYTPYYWCQAQFDFMARPRPDTDYPHISCPSVEVPCYGKKIVGVPSHTHNYTNEEVEFGNPTTRCVEICLSWLGSDLAYAQTEISHSPNESYACKCYDSSASFSICDDSSGGWPIMYELVGGFGTAADVCGPGVGWDLDGSICATSSNGCS